MALITISNQIFQCIQQGHCIFEDNPTIRSVVKLMKSKSNREFSQKYLGNQENVEYISELSDIYAKINEDYNLTWGSDVPDDIAMDILQSVLHKKQGHMLLDKSNASNNIVVKENNTLMKLLQDDILMRDVLDSFKLSSFKDFIVYFSSFHKIEKETALVYIKTYELVQLYLNSKTYTVSDNVLSWILYKLMSNPKTLREVVKLVRAYMHSKTSTLSKYLHNS